ncbi:hypothetical protein NDU88_004951 [Pleurodeles waltl]|uniref:Uncharacterized protein n=1 Tax=Pleurodeles waltl TaxID=8319 RepID=A0AAV7WTE0_PLEWA|nr:hypothetical protein NDU88_004951 [Pleurodeles waltl]
MLQLERIPLYPLERFASSAAARAALLFDNTTICARPADVFLMMQNITPPPFFLSLPGDPSFRWNKWKNVFLTYIRVCGSNLSADRKTSVLLHCLGAEGQETLSSINISDGADGDTALNEFDPTLLKLDRHYLPKIAIILQRYYFGKCKQTDTESVEDFAMNLRKLAAQCKFGGNLEERI